MKQRNRRGTIRSFRAAGILQLIQGALMEGLPFLALLAMLVVGLDVSVVTDRAEIFALPYLRENLLLMMAMSGIFGTLRVIGAVGLLRNRMWGLVLSLINCTVTLALMIFLLPAGILDGILSGTALVLILTARLSRRPITPLVPEN